MTGLGGTLTGFGGMAGTGEGGEAGEGAAGGSDAVGGSGGTGGSSGDECPDDPDKTEPGLCGCDVPDTDRDGDDTPDCDDMCPDEASKTEPGACGCNVPAAEEAVCAVVKNGIIHRYSFAGSGTTASDSVGSQNGTIMNGGTQSGGRLALAGSSSQYVNLPADMVSGLTDATFEAWFTWNGGAQWQRIFDFGNTTGSPAQGLSYIYLSVLGANSVPRSAITTNGVSNETRANGSQAVTTGVAHHMAVVVNETGGTLTLYLDGTLEQETAYTGTLGSITDTLGYLGRSLYAADPYFDGSLNEFRIYDVALSKAQLDYSIAGGADAPFLE